MHRNRRALDGAHGGDHRTKPNAARMRALGKDSKVGALGDMPDAARVEIGRGDGAGNRTGRFPQSAGGITPRGLQGLRVRRGAAFTGKPPPRPAVRGAEALSGRRSGSVNPSASSQRTAAARSPRILRATRSSTPPPPPDSWSNHWPESSRTASEPLRPYRSSRAVLIRGFGSPSSARATGRARLSKSRGARIIGPLSGEPRARHDARHRIVAIRRTHRNASGATGPALRTTPSATVSRKR